MTEESNQKQYANLADNPNFKKREQSVLIDRKNFKENPEGSTVFVRSEGSWNHEAPLIGLTQ